MEVRGRRGLTREQLRSALRSRSTRGFRACHALAAVLPAIVTIVVAMIVAPQVALVVVAIVVTIVVTRDLLVIAKGPDRGVALVAPPWPSWA